VVLGRRMVGAGELVRFSFPTASLRAPGVGELRATFGSGQRSAEARARVVVTATAHFSAPTAIDANADGEAELELKLDSRLGPVGSGSIEARSDGRTVGIAAVLPSGSATLALRLGAGSRQVPVKLRYLSSTPWWIAGPERELVVSVARASPLRRLPWALVLVALAAWLGFSWWRPRRAVRVAPRRETPAHRAPVPAVVWQPAEDKASGWSGRVIDAHDESPLAGARIDFTFAGGTSSATTGPGGQFHLDSPAGEREGTLSVSAPWHARLERALPPPGKLGIALVTRRRALLARLVELAAGLRPRREGGEPTPDEVARQAAGDVRGEVAVWARAVEGAVYGPEPVDAEREAAVSALEPRLVPESADRPER